MSMANREGTLDLSVLIASRNRERLLELTLSHFKRQQIGEIRWEVIVVDNGSTDNTASVLACASEQLPLVSIYESRPGKNGALNRALAVARGNLLVFTDDDVEPSSQWLGSLFSASQRWPACSIFCGPIFPSYPAEAPVWIQDFPYADVAFSKFVPAISEGELPNNILPFGPNFAVRACALNGLRFCTRLGPCGQSYPMGGETGFLKKLVEGGERIIFVPPASVKHIIGKHQIELDWLFQRAFNHGRGMARIRYHDLDPQMLREQMEGIEKILSDMPSDPPRNLLEHEQLRFEKEARRRYLSGQLYEYRVLAAETNEPDKSSSDIHF
jgi:glycosyltransferase involved in cell wall biosynthesis